MSSLPRLPSSWRVPRPYLEGDTPAVLRAPSGQCVGPGLGMESTNTRRWPRYHVHLPVFIAAQPGAADIVVPGLVSELSRSGMELYGGVNRRLGEEMEVEFQTPGGIRISGIVRNRSGFCFGLEFFAVWTELGEPPDVPSSTFPKQEVHEAYDRLAGAKFAGNQRQAAISPPRAQRNAGPSFADRARELIRRGYKPKVATELVLHELEFEYRNDAVANAKARVDAREFLLEIRKGLI
jgi:hypothetical protein